MPKKFVPDPELLNVILTRYKETKNYNQVSRETGLSTAIIKRIITEAAAGTTPTETTVEKPRTKPLTAAQTLALRKEYIYTGPVPIEKNRPEKKMVYYGKISVLMEDFLNVHN